MGTILMHIDLAKPKTNFFTGRVQIKTLEQFYKVFFSKKVEELMLATPPTLLDSEFINELEVKYIPEPQTVNGRDYHATFVFSGQVNFHNLVG